MLKQVTSEPEVELKLIVGEDALQVLEQHFLTSFEGKFQQKKLVLENDYYDSPDGVLRGFNIACRVRSSSSDSSQSQFEQTIKTKGTNIGGLSQRPETNVTLLDRSLNLQLFPKQLWPKALDLDALQHNIVVLFSTHYTRHLFLLSDHDNNVVELVLDLGYIVSANKKERICEIELELKQGKGEQLFKLAKQLAKLMPVKIGQLSKAARGHRLYRKAKHPHACISHEASSGSTHVEFPSVDNLLSKRKTWWEMLALCLQYWQAHHHAYSEKQEPEHALAAHKALQALQLILSTKNGAKSEAKFSDIVQQISTLLVEYSSNNGIMHSTNVLVQLDLALVIYNAASKENDKSNDEHQTEEFMHKLAAILGQD